MMVNSAALAWPPSMQMPTTASAVVCEEHRWRPANAAMRATGGELIAVNATGCLEVFTTPYPETSWQMPWMQLLVGNAAAVGTGIAAAL